MGFGLICAGYSTLLFMRLVPVEIIGFIFVLKGIGKLRGFNRFFEYARISVYPVLVFSFADAVCRIPGISDFAGRDHVQVLLTDLHRLCLLPFCILILLAVREISAELGFTRGIKRSALALSIVFVYYLVYVISRIGFDVITKYLSAAEIIIYILMFLAVEAAVYACYRSITTDEAEKREEEKLRQFEARFGRKKKTASPSPAAKKGKTFRKK